MKLLSTARIGPLCALLISQPVLAQSVSTEFTLTTNSTADAGRNYTDFTKGENTGTSQFTIGFEIEVTSINGNAVSINPLTGFCVEIEEPISRSSYTGFEIVDLENVSTGRAGESGTASIGIPIGGIGGTRAGQVRYLYDNYYQDTSLLNWDNSTVSNTQAFQLALWEVTHDSDLDLSNVLGDIFIGTQADQPGNDTIALAQLWLDAIDTAGIGAAYQSQTYNVWALADTDNEGVTGNQDVLVATLINSPDDEIFVTNAPEPSSALLALMGCLLMARRSR